MTVFLRLSGHSKEVGEQATRITGEIMFHIERHHSAKYSGRRKATTRWAIEINSGM